MSFKSNKNLKSKKVQECSSRSANCEEVQDNTEEEVAQTGEEAGKEEIKAGVFLKEICETLKILRI